ncbi:sugar phosphate isomerase/epimerase family protein [Georgenia sp. AZ-5]|uniref:sugar phosphate isomerase/epimerase family protein n=1 Tax=Georgenia sp. AZ-5 TaxID=3367526 RepID=UPI003754A6CE
MSPRSRLAANPIPYWLRRGEVRKTVDAFALAFADLHDIGYRAVVADVPDGMAADDYRHWLSIYDLEPAVGFFSSPIEGVDLSAEVSRARRFAAVHVELGLDCTMLAAAPVRDRWAQPAVGAGYSESRLARVTDGIGLICEALNAEGLRPLLHPLVGGLVETELEIRTVLDTLGPAFIGFGPDTGHMCWAGVDPADMIRHYPDRIGAIHLSDVFEDHLRPATRESNAAELIATGRLWAGLGTGVVDFPAVLAALPPDFDGDFVTEVDRPSTDSIYKSHEASFQWATKALADLIESHESSRSGLAPYLVDD